MVNPTRMPNEAADSPRSEKPFSSLVDADERAASRQPDQDRQDGMLRPLVVQLGDGPTPQHAQDQEKQSQHQQRHGSKPSFRYDKSRFEARRPP